MKIKKNRSALPTGIMVMDPTVYDVGDTRNGIAEWLGVHPDEVTDEQIIEAITDDYLDSDRGDLVFVDEDTGKQMFL
jgi:hypothetical protein